MGKLQMTRAEREAFLADVHVGVISIEQPDRPPLTVPIWYDYEPGGDVTILTSPSTVKGRLLAAAGRFSLCAQTEDVPYQYVTVEGPVVEVRPADRETDVRPMARRYLGAELGDRYTDGLPEVADDAIYAMHPKRWYSVDYGKITG